MIERDQIQQRAIRLFEELQHLHAKAKALRYDDLERWRLSLRANVIARDLKRALEEQRMAQ